MQEVSVYLLYELIEWYIEALYIEFFFADDQVIPLLLSVFIISYHCIIIELVKERTAS